jgi:multidrug efflux pump subunit AcrA (membrane-fusion protein)
VNCTAPRTRLALLLAASATGTLLACGKKAPEPPPPAAAAPAARQSARTPWVKARPTENVAMLQAPALVLAAPEASAAVSAAFRARVARILVRPGDRVRRGQPLLDVVMPEVVTAAGQFGAAQTRVEAYGRRKAQLEALKGEGLVKLTEILEVDTKLAESRAEMQGALAMLRAADLDAEGAARLLQGAGSIPLRSPIEGVVSEVKATLGETREPSGEPFVRLAGEGEARVEARIARNLPGPAHYFMVLAGGESVRLWPVGRSPVVDPRDGTQQVWFKPLPGERALPQGATGRLMVKLENDESIAAVPARSVGLSPEGPYVVRSEGGKAVKKPVEVLATSGSDALVKGGVKPGDEVAADAALALEPEEK